MSLRRLLDWETSQGSQLLGSETGHGTRRRPVAGVQCLTTDGTEVIICLDGGGVRSQRCPELIWEIPDNGPVLSRGVSMNALQQGLEELAHSRGVDLFGVADMAPARHFITQQGGEVLGQFPLGISLAIHTSDTIVDQLPRDNGRRERLTLFNSYRAHTMQVGDTLEKARLELAQAIGGAGYRAFITFGGTDDEKLLGPISQKVAAHLSGLGWIGKNCLLVSPHYGPRLRLATLLTDAPLEPGSPHPDRCGECQLCVEVCPSQSIRGVAFNPEEPQEARFDVQRCRLFLTGQLRSLGAKSFNAPGHVCGLCLYICPFGRKRQRAEMVQ